MSSSCGAKHRFASVCKLIEFCVPYGVTKMNFVFFYALQRSNVNRSAETSIFVYDFQLQISEFFVCVCSSDEHGDASASEEGEDSASAPLGPAGQRNHSGRRLRVSRGQG